MARTQEKLIESFKDGATEGKASNMSISDSAYWTNFNGPVLFSYNEPICLWLSHSAKGAKFIMNNDTFSNVTSRQQWKILRTLGDEVIDLPFSALRAAGINPQEIVIIDRRKDSWTTDAETQRTQHIPGAIAFRYGRRYYLFSMDLAGWRPQNFLVRLPQRPESVNDAFEILKPPELRGDNMVEGENYQRQGEWFFVPTGPSRPELMDENIIFRLKGFPSPKLAQQAQRNNRILTWRPTYRQHINGHIAKWYDLARGKGNYHVVRDTLYYTKDKLFCRGTVRHPEHGMLNLGEQWHKVYKNTALGSWSSEGGID